MKDWLLERQIWIAVAVAAASVLLMIVLGHPRWLGAAAAALIALVPIFIGGRLFAGDTSENWLRFSYIETGRSIIGGVLMLLGWAVLLRGVLASAIGAGLLKMG